MAIEYDEFFEKIKKFKEEQNKQKQRGLNDFNILTAVRKPHAEVGMHSNFLYALLNPDGLHYQDDLFVNLFIKYVLKIDNFGKVTKVSMEEPTNENRRIDVTIQSESYSIGIEMKIYAGDQDKQIYDYYNFLNSKVEKINSQKVMIYYLTLDGKEPSKESLNGLNKLHYKNISFKKDILKWLQKCQYEIQNITNLNEAIKQYIDVIETLLGTYQSKITSLSSFIMQDKDIFTIAQQFYMQNEKNILSLTSIQIDVIKAYEEAREIIAENFFTKKLVKFLRKTLNNTYKIDAISNQEDRYKITITKDDKKIIFGSKGYSTNNDYYKIADNINFTKYRYRFDIKTINDFYMNSENVKNYYLKITKKEL